MPVALALSVALMLHGVLFWAYTLLPVDTVPQPLTTLDVTLSPADPAPKTQEQPSVKRSVPVVPPPAIKPSQPPAPAPVQAVAAPDVPIITKIAPTTTPAPVTEAPQVVQALTVPAPEPPIAVQQEEIQPLFKLTRVPGFARKVEPIYPAKERNSGTQASVLAEVTLNSRGEVINVRIVKSGGSLFDEAVKLALQKSSFLPAMMGTKPVATRIMVPFRFNLN